LSCASHTYGLMRTSPLLNPQTLTSDTSLNKFSTTKLSRIRKHGSVLSKSTVYSKSRTSSQSNPSDGHHLVSQDLKAHIIAQSVPTTATVELLWMLITRHASTLELKFQDQTLKLCQVNGSSKSDPLLVSK